jgi:hypothetical protein
MTVALPILTVVVVLLAAIVVLLVRRVSNKSSHVLKCPPGFLHPAGSEKAFCMIAVDPVRSSKRWAEEAMVGAQKFEALQRAVEVATSQHNAIVVLSIPSKYYIAAETLLQAVEVAECAEQVMAADNAKNSAGCFIATHAIVTYGHLRVFKKQLDAENVRFGVGGQAANQLKKISGGLATSAQPVWGGICVPLAQFEALCERDPEISKRLVEMRHVMPQDASPPAAHDASSCEALRVAIIAHRCGEQQPTHSTHQQPPPAAAQASSADTLAVAAAPHTPAPLLAPTLPPLTSLPRHARQQRQHRDRGETDVTVLTERQYNALMQMFETIALRIVMCIPPAEQKAVALRLRQRLRIFLHDQLPPRAAVALTAARASHRHQSSSSSTSFDTVKDWELRQILPISTVMTLESMDELGLWEQVKDITR